jgi:hypothetical protein
MPPPLFLYIAHDCENHFFNARQPTKADYAAAIAGILTIVRLQDHHVFGRTAVWVLPVDGVRVRALGSVVTAHPGATVNPSSK